MIIAGTVTAIPAGTRPSTIALEIIGSDGWAGMIASIVVMTGVTIAGGATAQRDSLSAPLPADFWGMPSVATLWEHCLARAEEPWSVSQSSVVITDAAENGCLTDQGAIGSGSYIRCRIGGEFSMRAVIFSVLVASLVALPADAAICVRNRDIQSTTPLDGKTLIITMRDGTVWRNRLQGNCSDLRFNGFVWVIHGPEEVCEYSQSLKVLQSGQICVLGKFTREKPARR
jgi:hypothetical protein